MFNPKVIALLVISSSVALITWSVIEIQGTVPLLITPKEDVDASSIVTVKRTLDAWGTREPFEFEGEGVPVVIASPSAEVEDSTDDENTYSIRLVNASGDEELPELVQEALSEVTSLEISEITVVAETDNTIIESQSTVPKALRTQIQSILSEVHEQASSKTLSSSSSDDIIIFLGVK